MSKKELSTITSNITVESLDSVLLAYGDPAMTNDDNDYDDDVYFIVVINLLIESLSV